MGTVLSLETAPTQNAGPKEDNGNFGVAFNITRISHFVHAKKVVTALNSSMQKSSVFYTQLVPQHHAIPSTAVDEESFQSTINRGVRTNKCILFVSPFSFIQALHTYYSLHCLSIIIKI